MRFALALLLTAGPVVAAPVPKDFKKPDDRQLLVGAWKPADNGTAHFEFRADGTMRTWHSRNVGNPLEWTWTNLDPQAMPKRVTLTRTEGSGIYDCYYELTGDTLKVAFIVDKTLPVPGKLEPGRGLSFYLLTRDAPPK